MIILAITKPAAIINAAIPAAAAPRNWRGVRPKMRMSGFGCVAAGNVVLCVAGAVAASGAGHVAALLGAA